jgi:lipoprotein-anchoring transpeptidase ErfK/SrfK
MRQVRTMHQVRRPSRCFSVLLIHLCLLAGGGAARAQGACAQIKAICESAGFVAGAAWQGVGLQVDCIMPIMQGTPQRPRARRPLPQVDARLISACTATRPQFGRPNPQPTEAMQQPQPVPPPMMAKPVPDPRQANSTPAPSPGREATLQPPPGPPDQHNVIAALPPDDQPETGEVTLPPQFRRTQVDYATKEPAGTIIVDTLNTYLYLVLGNGKAMRYGIGVGREGFTWSGTEHISRMAEWPDWYPPAEMIERQPYLPRFMAGGESNPLGARALYLGNTLYRIHGTNQPSTIGSFVSSGCIRLTNEDIADLFGRIQVGTRVVVLPGKAPTGAASNSSAAAAGRPAKPRD